jgi:hypothetical protein
MANQSSFYEDLVKNCYTKTASDNSQPDEKDVKNMLDGCSTDTIEALAEELGQMFSKEASDKGNGKVMTQSVHEQQKSDKTKASEDKVVQPESQNVDDERDATGEESAEEAKARKEKEEMVNSVAKQLETKAASEILDELFNKEAGIEDGIDENTMKEAYELAQSDLEKEGYTVADYIFSKIADDESDEEFCIDLSEKIAATAEKLAMVSDRNALQVADDIIAKMAGIIDAADEE